jgi:hypothetical protein
MEFVVGNTALGQDFLRGWISPVNIILPLLHIHSFTNWERKLDPLEAQFHRDSLTLSQQQ